MKKSFGVLPSGEQASLYTISCGNITATVTDYGAHLVSLLVPDRNGTVADVVLGYDDANGYRTGGCFFGATVGRNANRIGGASFQLNGKTVNLTANDNNNNLHSGLEFFHLRMWDVVSQDDASVRFRLESPDGDQGFPGNATIDVTYRLDSQGGLHIVYDATCDQDTVFNLTNHSYFNLAGHDRLDQCMEQKLFISCDYITPDDAVSIPTGELRSVADTPFDFRNPKAIGRDINADYDQLNMQGGYDHNHVILSNPCAVLTTADESRTMEVWTDCPGVQFYAGNYIVDEAGKGGIHYTKRTGICLETQFYPDALHNPAWPQPITKAGQPYHSETVYKFI